MTDNGLLPTINYTTPSGASGARKPATGLERDRWNRSADADRFDAFLRRAQRSATDDRQTVPKRSERPGPAAPTDPGAGHRTERPDHSDRSLPPNRSDRPTERARMDETGHSRSGEPVDGEAVGGDQPMRGTDRSSTPTDSADRTADPGDGISGDLETDATSTAGAEGETGPADPGDAATTTADSEAGRGADKHRDDSGVEYRPAVEPAVVMLPSGGDADAAAAGLGFADGQTAGGHTIDDQTMEAADGAPTEGASTAGVSTDGASTDGASTDGASTDGRQLGAEEANDIGHGSGPIDDGGGSATESADRGRSTMPHDAPAGPVGATTDGIEADTAAGADAIGSDDTGGTPGPADELEGDATAGATAAMGPDRPATGNGAASAQQTDVAGGETDSSGAQATPAGDAAVATVPGEDGGSPVEEPADAEASETGDDGDTDARAAATAAGLQQPTAEQGAGSPGSRKGAGSTGVGATNDSMAAGTDARLVDPTTGVPAPVAGSASNRGAGDRAGEAGVDAGMAPDGAAIDELPRTAAPNGGSTDGGGNDPSAGTPTVVPPATAAASAAAGSASGASTIGQMTAAEVAHAGLDASALAPAMGDQADGTDPLWQQVRRALGSLRTTPTGEQQLTIRLRPAELGSVVVRINSGDAGTAVSLVTESSAAANQLNQQRQQLIRDLEDGGFVGVNVDIGSDADTGRTQTGQPDGDAERTGGQGVLGGTGDPTAIDADLARGYGARRDRGPSIGLIDVDL